MFLPICGQVPFANLERVEPVGPLGFILDMLGLEGRSELSKCLNSDGASLSRLLTEQCLAAVFVGSENKGFVGEYVQQYGEQSSIGFI